METCDFLWKYYKNIVNVTLFLKFLPRFRQQHFFFPSHFRQWHCHNSIQFLYPIFGNAIATITKKKISFFPLFRQWHCRTEFGQRNFGNNVAEIPLLSLSNFFSFSLLLLLNFSNTVAEILSLFSIPQLSSNNTYNTN